MYGDLKDPMHGALLPRAQQGGMNGFLGSPGMAMASQAANNISALRRNQVPNRTPVDAFSEGHRRNQLVENQRLETLQRQQAYDLRRKELQWQMSQKKPRDMKKAADGYLYYTDGEKERAYPDVVAAPRGPLVSVNNIPPTPREEIADMGGFDEKAAKDVFRANLEGIPNLLNIGSQYEPEYLTTAGQFSQQYASLKDRAGLELPAEDVQKLRDYTQFSNNVEQYFNSYRKMITGAAASEKEMESLRKSIFNMDQGPVAFQASLDNMQQKMARELRGAIYLQATGVAEMGTESMRDALTKRSASTFASDEHLDTVADYIAATLNIDPDTADPDAIATIYRQMKSMGFKVGE